MQVLDEPVVLLFDMVRQPVRKEAKDLQRRANPDRPMLELQLVDMLGQDLAARALCLS